MEKCPPPSRSTGLDLVILAAFHCTGISKIQKHSETISGNIPSISATLENSPDLFWHHYERLGGLATALLSGLVGGGPGGTPEERLQFQIDRVHSERIKKYQSGVFLIVRQFLQIDIKFELPVMSGSGFYYTFEAYDKKHYHQKAIRSAAPYVLATQLSAPPDVSSDISQVGAISYVEHPDDHLPIYSFTPELGTAGISVARVRAEDRADSISKMAQLIQTESSLQQYMYVFLSSSSAGNISIREAILSWSAMEMMINDLHSRIYLKIWIAKIAEAVPSAPENYMQQLSKSLGARHTLIDKFIVVSGILNTEGCGNDRHKFTTLKSRRDNLYHAGDNFYYNAFYLDTKELFLRYLNLHIQFSN